MQKQTFYGHGKLLLTGEYAVLDGAKALAIPTRFGQKLQVETRPSTSTEIIWKSYTHQNEIWLNYHSLENNFSEEAKMLEKILNEVKNLNPIIFKENTSYHFSTHLEFDRKWGLGSSSTLLYCLSQWANIKAFDLLAKTFGGSGYDLASAGEDTAIFYTKKENKATWQNLDLDLPMKENLFFVYLGKKKNSREAIAHYKAEKSTESFLQEVSQLSTAFSQAKTLQEIQKIITTHENLLADRLKTPSINQTIFSDLDGVAKSLGGWGGDFALLATAQTKTELTKYIQTKGLQSIFSYDEMIFKPK